MAQFITIKIPQFDTKDLRKRLVLAMDRRGRRNENLLLRTTQYFETVKPVFTSEANYTGEDWEIITAPIDDESGQIWSYLDQGTEIRYAHMSEGYSPGTTPGTFQTQPTVGRRAWLSTTKKAAEGIEERGWTELLAEEELEPFAGELRSTLKSWSKRWASRASEIISG